MFPSCTYSCATSAKLSIIMSACGCCACTIPYRSDLISGANGIRHGNLPTPFAQQYQNRVGLFLWRCTLHAIEPPICLRYARPVVNERYSHAYVTSARICEKDRRHRESERLSITAHCLMAFGSLTHKIVTHLSIIILYIGEQLSQLLLIELRSDMWAGGIGARIRVVSAPNISAMISFNNYKSIRIWKSLIRQREKSVSYCIIKVMLCWDI